MVELLECVRRLGPGVEFRCDEFRAEAGEMVALCGPSGCGKSTLLNLISGLLRPDKGVIRVDGAEIQNFSEEEMDKFRGERIGFVFQTFNLLQPFTAIQNVMLGMRFSDTRSSAEWKPRAMELLDRVGLSHRCNSKPKTMSVGEQQRVAIARALANRQKLILADEPTGSLDPKTAAEVMDLLLKLCVEEKVTLLLVTHDPSIAARFPRVYDCTHLVKDLNG